MSETAIKIENMKKKYKLGTIGGQTLNSEIQSWWARKRGKEDPNLKIGQEMHCVGEEFWALDGINLEVCKGETLGIIGGNGAGKSTLLKILSRVTAPSRGDIWINGRIASMLEVGTGFHGELTGRENIYMNGAILGMTKREVDKKIESIIDFSECRQFIDTPVKRYSSGMYVKLAFAVASHLDAEIMIMDEVLAVGDMKFQQKCLGKMSGEAQEGKTILYVSHNMDTIRMLCQRCIVLRQGRIIYDGDTETAISLYLDEIALELRPFVELQDAKRSGVECTQYMHIMNIEFIGKYAPRFLKREGVSFKVGVKFNEDIAGLRFIIRLKTGDDRRIGVTWSDPVISGRKGEFREFFVHFDVSNLNSGRYCFLILASQTSELGVARDYDRPLQNVFFEIIDDMVSEVQWRSSWGPVKIGKMEIMNGIQL